MAKSITKDEARRLISELVAKFQAVESVLRNTPESQIENDYIRPLFRYLNWKIESAGLRPSEREMVLVETNPEGKRPDYRFQLNGQHLFFMDAKQVKYDMHDPRWLWQVYRYAYSTQNHHRHKVDFAVLTDFKEFVVLDCTLLAQTPEAVQNFRVPKLDWKYTDFVTHFDELWDVFERNNMLAASQERKTGLWSYYVTPKQAKANRIKPDEGFLYKLDNDKDGWRIRLAKDMKKCDPLLDGDVITGAVQLLIDRLVFIKTLSDRDIDEDFLAKLADIIDSDGQSIGSRGWFVAARPLFERLNVFYNGSMFAPRPELDAVVTSNRIVRQIIRELDPEHSPYHLGVLPIEILGTIYERFLGKVVRTTKQRVKIEEKPEVRKAGGIYYTPEYIVEYIIEHTIGKLLTGCRTPDDVAKLKILDPSCGSGSFLIRAYNALIEWYKSYYAGKAKFDRNVAYRDADGDIRLTARLKRQILLNNIFGVDIDPQAVEVTRFSLSLKALEETRKDELDDERSLFKETVLPDLNINIVCGNSVIGTDILKGLLFKQSEELDLNPMDYEDKFPDVVPPGFDAVIGNPPWISLSGKFGNVFLPQGAMQYLIARYKGNTYMPNMYEYFVANGLTLTKTHGVLGHIVPDRLGFNAQFIRLRERILKETSIEILKYKLPFPGITADTLVFVLRKEVPEQSHQLEVSEHGKQAIFISQADLLTKDQYQFEYKIDIEQDKLAKRICALPNVRPLSRVASCTSGFGGRSELISEKRVSDKQIRTMKGDSIGRYEHRKSYWFEFKKKNITGRTTDQVKLGSLTKILLRKTGNSIIATYDDSGVFPEQSLYFLYDGKDGTDFKYLLGVINSRLLNWYFKKCCLTNEKSIAQVKTRDLEKLPIRTIELSIPTDKAQHDRMVQMVDQMLKAKKQAASAQTQKDQTYYREKCDSLDREIDSLVFKLYGLTQDERQVIEAAGQ